MKNTYSNLGWVEARLQEGSIEVGDVASQLQLNGKVNPDLHTLMTEAFGMVKRNVIRFNGPLEKYANGLSAADNAVHEYFMKHWDADGDDVSELGRAGNKTAAAMHAASTDPAEVMKDILLFAKREYQAVPLPFNVGTKHPLWYGDIQRTVAKGKEAGLLITNTAQVAKPVTTAKFNALTAKQVVAISNALLGYLDEIDTMEMDLPLPGDDCMDGWWRTAFDYESDLSREVTNLYYYEATPDSQLRFSNELIAGFYELAGDIVDVLSAACSKR